jgi:polysaccharide deacetylase family protein (PEP-CTERM system associated)
MPRTHCLTFDIEEHFQVSAFDSLAQRGQWDRLESRVQRNTEKILAILETRKISATFFVLGWVAERHPNLIRALASAGHEVASHGYEHRMVTTQTPDQFREDIRKSKTILENLIGAEVMGYRAPSFTIVKQTQWALQILVEEGYRYDSSIFPIRHDRYGMPGARPYRHRLDTPIGSIWEVPPATVQIARARFPVAGGGYFRFFPYPLLRTLLKWAESEGEPLVIYLHPWELDPQQPRMQGGVISRLRHYLNLEKTEGRLLQLLGDFKFGPIRDAVWI